MRTTHGRFVFTRFVQRFSIALARQDDTTTSREKILKKIRKALLVKGEPYAANVDMDTDVHVPEDGEPLEVFAGNFTRNNGHFHYCFNGFDFLDQFLAIADQKEWGKVLTLEPDMQSFFAELEFPLKTQARDVLEAEVGVTGCTALLARTGSIAISSHGNMSRTASVFPPAHAVIAFRDQMHYDLKDFLPEAAAKGLPSMLSIISGPSRTADIEKTLVLGAHGPKEIHVFYIDQEKPW